MSKNVSEVLPNSLGSPNLVKWQCFGFENEILSLDEGFRNNTFLLAFANLFTALFSLVSNSLVIYGVCRNKFLGKISKSLTILLAIEGVLGGLVIQLLYVIAKFIMLANIHSLPNVSYCMLMLVVVSGTKILGGVSIATMLGITAERYAAVIYPHQYASHKRSFPKVLTFLSVIFLTHFILIDIWAWYKNSSKIVTVLLTFIPYVFTVYACGKIYFKLRHLDKIRGNCNNHSAALVTRNIKSLKSFLVVGSYMVCYLPLVVIRGLNLDQEVIVVQLYIRPWFITLVFCSFSVNALIYGWRSAKIENLCKITTTPKHVRINRSFNTHLPSISIQNME